MLEDKQIIGGRGSAKSYTTLNTIEVMLENEKLTEALKAKEQECEKLKSDYFTVIKQRNIAEQQLDQLKAENDKLKVRNIEYMNGNIGYQLKNSLYKQTLTEIKEIANNGCYDDCGMPLDELSIILQKINEVIPE